MAVVERKTLLGRLGEVSRHPLVVGGALAVLSAIFASLLIPSLTRVWQDRPKELALKASLVEAMSRSATDALAEARFYLFVSERGGVQRGNGVYIRITKPWQTESSIIFAQLTTYFRGSELQREWRTYVEAVREYEFACAFYGVAGTTAHESEQASLERLRIYFRGRRFSDRRNERMRRRFLLEKSSFDALASEVWFLFLHRRDELTASVVDMPATGFSHGFWIFK